MPLRSVPRLSVTCHCIPESGTDQAGAPFTFVLTENADGSIGFEIDPGSPSAFAVHLIGSHMTPIGEAILNRAAVAPAGPESSSPRTSATG